MHNPFMKKQIIFAGIAALVSLAACSKVENSIETLSKGKTVSLTVNSAEWAESKSAYTPGVGVAMTGTEILSLYYATGETLEKGDVVANLYAGTEAARNKSIKAVPTSADKYTFTAPAASAGCTWYSIAGYSKVNTTLVTDYSAPGVIISPVQNPLPNSFDPQFDYMVGKPFQVNEDGTATIECFKRLLAPLRLNVSGLSAGEKIYTATLSFDQEPAANTSNDGLVGKVYIHFGDEPETSVVDYSEAAAKGNAVTAVYAEGLEAVGGSWPVWYIVNPVTIAAGADMTVTISTSNATYTRTVSLSADAAISRASLNNINFNIKGEGFTEEESFTTVFTKANASGSLTASNGNSYNWAYAVWNGASKDDGSGISNCMNLNNGSVTIPNVYDKFVTKVKLISHACNNLSLARESFITTDSTPAVTFGFNFCSTPSYDVNLLSEGGAAAVARDGFDSFEGVTFTGNAQAILVSAITLFTVNGGESEPVVEEATGNDLYQEFLDGKKITINGVAYTKDNCTYDLLNLSSAANTAIQAAGVHFVTGTKDFGSGTNLKLTNPVVLIGRYRDAPASMSASQFQPSADAIFKNVSITGTNSNNSFPSSQLTQDAKLVFENCTLNNAGALARDVHATYSYDLVCRNCVITYKANALFFLNKKVAASHSSKEYTLEGNTITCAAATGLPLFDMTNGAFAPADLVFTFTDNTVNGAAAAAGVFNFKTLKSLTITGNTFTSSETAPLLSATTAPSEASIVSDNTLPAGWKVFAGDPIANITAN